MSTCWIKRAGREGEKRTEKRPKRPKHVQNESRMLRISETNTGQAPFDIFYHFVFMR